MEARGGDPLVTERHAGYIDSRTLTFSRVVTLEATGVWLSAGGVLMYVVVVLCVCVCVCVCVCECVCVFPNSPVEIYAPGDQV